MKQFYVTKADGSQQLYDRNKVLNTCRKMRLAEADANAVVDRVEKELHDGIGTKKILQLVFRYVRKYRPEVAHRIDLRQAIAFLRPKPDFEKFVGHMLEAEGYEVETNLIVSGRCVDHEIDAVAKRGKDVVCVEVKHHYNEHTYTGVGIFLEAWATLEDLQAGYAANKNSIGFNKLLVVCNTKISDYAKAYAKCKGFEHLAWKTPEMSLERIVEEHRLYPVTLMKGIGSDAAARLGDSGIVLLKQFVREDIKKLSKKMRLPKDKVRELVSNANKILSL
jgi:hypothetical protein